MTVIPVSRWTAVTGALAMMAPVGSVTTPVNVADAVWAKEEVADATSKSDYVRAACPVGGARADRLD